MEEETTGQSRLFVILSIALIGLLVLGLLGIGGVFVIRQNMEEQALASRPTPTVLIRLPEPVATSPPIKNAIATNTPAPTPTNTPVVPSAGGADAAAAGGQNRFGSDIEEGEASKTKQEVEPALVKEPTPAPATEIASAAEVPNTGLGALESVFLALGLIGVFVVTRRLRMKAA